jgi:uncharacterized membrane protein YhaH (DUF805 family)
LAEGRWNSGFALVQLALALPGWAVWTRRMHDTGRSGWWWLLGLTIIGVIPILFWLCQSGPNADNQYGPSPYRRPR